MFKISTIFPECKSDYVLHVKPDNARSKEYGVLILIILFMTELGEL